MLLKKSEFVLVYRNIIFYMSLTSLCQSTYVFIVLLIKCYSSTISQGEYSCLFLTCHSLSFRKILSLNFQNSNQFFEFTVFFKLCCKNTHSFLSFISYLLSFHINLGTPLCHMCYFKVKSLHSCKYDIF